MDKLNGFIKQFEHYKGLGDKTINSLSFEELQKEFAPDTNSMAVLVNHLSGNMLSRWTHFLTEDGEKNWRNRDSEFINSFTTKDELIKRWNHGWNSFLSALKSITDDDLEKIIYIRNEAHTISEAINRQLNLYLFQKEDRYSTIPRNFLKIKESIDSKTIHKKSLQINLKAFFNVLAYSYFAANACAV